MSDAKWPGAYAVQNDGVDAPEERVAPQSLMPPRATSIPPASLGPSPDRRAEQALRRLSECGPDDEGPALAALLALEEKGLAAVESTFPGLLWFHRNIAHAIVPAGRDCGPSCRVLSAFGDKAIPTLARLMEGHADARYYAVLLSSDLLKTTNAGGARILVESLMARILDADEGVANAAMATLENHRDTPAVKAQAAAYCAQLRDPAQGYDARVALLRTLAVLRWPGLVPASIELLSDASSELQTMAAGALRLMTAGPRAGQRHWRRWWKKNQDKPRTDWLIDALSAGQSERRQIAHGELVVLLGDSVTYNAEMGWWSRRRAQRAFRALASKASDKRTP